MPGAAQIRRRGAAGGARVPARARSSCRGAANVARRGVWRRALLAFTGAVGARMSELSRAAMRDSPVGGDVAARRARCAITGGATVVGAASGYPRSPRRFRLRLRVGRSLVATSGVQDFGERRIPTSSARARRSVRRGLPTAGSTEAEFNRRSATTGPPSLARRRRGGEVPRRLRDGLDGSSPPRTSMTCSRVRRRRCCERVSLGSGLLDPRARQPRRGPELACGGRCAGPGRRRRSDARAGVAVVADPPVSARRTRRPKRQRCDRQAHSMARVPRRRSMCRRIPSSIRTAAKEAGESAIAEQARGPGQRHVDASSVFGAQSRPKKNGGWNRTDGCRGRLHAAVATLVANWTALVDARALFLVSGLGSKGSKRTLLAWTRKLLLLEGRARMVARSTDEIGCPVLQSVH